MLLLRRIFVFGLIYFARSGETLKPPDFNSGWIDLLTYTNETATNKVLLHGLLETPLLVDVQVKDVEDGTIFQANGHMIQNKNLRTSESTIDSVSKCGKLRCDAYEPEEENGVIYIYNHRVVKVIALARNKQKTFGRCKYTVDLPDGLLRKFRVRAWKSSSLPEPSFTLSNELGNGPLTEVSHGLSKYPYLVISRVKYAHAICESFQNTYSDSIGAPTKMLYESPEKTGYVMYEYDKENVYIRRSPEIFVASDGTGTEETVMMSGILEIFVWNSTDLQAITKKEPHRYDPISIPTVPCIKYNDTTPLTELLNNTVEAMDVLINKSVSVSSLIDKEMKLSQFLNTSLTVGELLNTTHINDIVKTDSDTTLKQIMDMTETIRIVLNGTLTFHELLDLTLSITHVVDKNIPISPVLNTTLSAGIQFNDTIVFSEFIDDKKDIVKVVNDTLFVKDSFQYFEVFNESLELNDIFSYESILFQYRRFFKSLRKVNDTFEVLEIAVNDIKDSANDYNTSLLNGRNNTNNTEETEQQLEYLDEVFIILSGIESVVLNMTESVNRLEPDNITLAVIENENLHLSELTNNSFEGFSNISGLLEDITELTLNVTTQPEYVVLNETFVRSNAQTEIVKQEVENLLLETITLKEMIDNDDVKWDSEISILEQISTNINLGKLVNSSVFLRDVFDDSATLRDLEKAENKILTYLDEGTQISDIVNDHGNAMRLVDVLEKSNEPRNQALQPNRVAPLDGNYQDDYLVRVFVESYNIENTALRTMGSGTLLWFEHMVVPVVCHFGGMIYGLTPGSVKIWYPNHPECSALCLETTTECTNSLSCDIESTNQVNMMLVIKIWNIESSYCSSEPCQNNGVCTNLPTTYNCTCADGWTGDNCEININDCIGKCQNFIHCVDMVNDYTCVCEDGWLGKNCSSEAKPFKVLQIKGTESTPIENGNNYCDSNPCENGGSCYNEGYTYNCYCTDHWTGINCKIVKQTTTTEQEEVTQTNPPRPTEGNNYCDSKPCKNGGSCYSEGDTYYCRCSERWTGDICDIVAQKDATYPTEGTDMTSTDGVTSTPDYSTDVTDNLTEGYEYSNRTVLKRTSVTDYSTDVTDPSTAVTDYSTEVSDVPKPVTDAPTLVTDAPTEDSLVTKHVEGLLVILGTNEFDLTEFSIIKTRHMCTNYVIDIERQETPYDVLVTVELLGDTCFSSISSCTIYWGDEASTVITLSDVSTKRISHTYTKDGVYDITTECVGENDTKTYCPETNSCMDNFLDDTYKDYSKPRRVMTDKIIEINSYDDVSKSCDGATYNWRFLQMSEDNMIPFTHFIQPNSGRLALPRGTLSPGIYVVILEVMQGQYWSNDFMVLEVALPEIHTFISGGEFLYVPHGNVVNVNASSSRDIAVEFNLGNTSESVSEWTFGLISNTNSDLEVYNIMNKNLSSVSNMFEIESGNINILEIDTNDFPLDSFGVAVFKLTNGNRSSTVFQVLKFVDNVLPVSVGCIYNCNASEGGLINYDKLTLETQIGMNIHGRDLIYEWNIYSWLNNTFEVLTAILDDTDTPSLTVPKDVVEEAKPYIFEVKVRTNNNTLRNTVSIKRTFDYVPHGGTCEVYNDNGGTVSEVTSASDWIKLKCQSWSTRSLRLTTDGIIETDPILTYTVLQYTGGAFIEQEPITQRGDREIPIMLKIGNHEKNYETSIKVRIADVYHNFNETSIYNIRSKPVINVNDIDETESGAQIIRDYIENKYWTNLERLLYGVDRPAATVYYISTVCSNLYLIEYSEKEPIVPNTLNENGNGVVLDLSKDGNSTITNFQDTLENSLNVTLSPTTYILREFLKNMTDLVTNISITLTQHPAGVTDKEAFSVLTNSFSNLASKAQFLDKVTKAHLVELIESTGSSNIDDDVENTLEEAAEQTFKMSMSVSSATVSSSLDQYRSVDDINGAMHQIDDMLSIIGDDLNIYTATISPQERAMLYYKMQGQLYLFIDEVKENAKTAANSTVRLARDIQDKLKQCRQCDNKVSGTAKQLLKTTDACKLKNEMSKTLTSAFNLDGIASYDNASCEDTQVSVSAFEFEENIYMYDDDGTSSLITSNVLRLDVKTSDKRVSAEHITFEQGVITPKAIHTQPFVDEEDASQFMYHRFLYQKSTESVCVAVEPLGEQDIQSYSIYIRFSGSPSVIDYDIKFHVSKNSDWQTCLDPHRMKGHSGVTYLAISFQGRNLNSSNVNTDKSIRSNEKTKEEERFDYNITISTMGCLTWEEEKAKWNYDKCRLMQWRRDEGKIVCLCRDVTDMVFGNSFFVAPNAIDFSTVFLKFSPLSQAAVMGTLGGFFIIYIISVILLSRLDKKDSFKWAITPLRDNYIIDEYFYVITVMTGMRSGAGTRSRIAFHLSGEDDSSGHRELFDGIREEFSTGSVMSFIMSNYDDLGDLQSLRIWHDNSGEGSFASWYLNQVDVFDLQRSKTHAFPFETWLSIETGLEATLTSIPTNQPLDLESRFFGNLRHRLSEGHMFISIMYRPVMSVFTRVQRASCAFVFIMLNMLANALYFNPEPNYQIPALIQVGPFRFTSQQIYISVFCALFTTIPVCFLIELFKRTKRRKPQTDDKSSCCSSLSCRRCKGGSKYRYKHEEMLYSIPLSMDEAQMKSSVRFPPRCMYLAWFIVAGGTIIPAFVILLFSMEWGKQKSEEWLTTLTMSLLESIFLIDPFVVICISFLLAVILRSRTSTKDPSVIKTVFKYRHERGEKENTVSSSFSVLKSIVTEFNSYKSYPREASEPIQGDNLKKVQERQRQYKNFQNSLKDIKFNLILIFLVTVICYSNRDVRSYLHHMQLDSQLVKPRDTQKFHSIKTPNELYSWINKTMLPYLFREHDEFGIALHWTERQMTQDIHFRLGPPRLRQVRIKNGTSNIPYIGRTPVYDEYEIWNEEDGSYCIGWKQGPCNIAESVYNLSSPAWTFRSSLELWGLPLTGYYTTYGGGGYIAALNVNLNYSIATINELYKNLWIDRQTRAVILEFTLYDASTNLFIYNMFMIEFPQTGGAFTSYHIYPLRVYQHHGAAGTWTLVCEVLFVVYLICLLIKIGVRIYRQRMDYFKKFWTVYELVLVIVAVAAICLFSLRLVFTYKTINKFKQDIRMFVNFSHIMIWDQLLVIDLGVLAFLATIRMLEVLSTLKHLKSIVDIFRKCGNDLFWYGVSFVQLFIGFCGLAVLLFGSNLESYRNLYQCMGTLFIAMIGKSRFTEINETQPILAKVFFLLYVVVVVYFFLTIFLSILGASIDEVVQQNRTGPEHDIINYVLRKLKDLISKPANIVKKKKTVKPSPFS